MSEKSTRAARALEATGRPGGISADTINTLVNFVPVEKVMERLKEMLDATTPGGTFPDWRARENAIKLWLSYAVGLPVQRVEETQTRVNVQIDPEKLLSNPASLEAIARKLQGTDAGARLLAELSKPRQAQGTVIEQS